MQHSQIYTDNIVYSFHSAVELPNHTFPSVSSEKYILEEENCKGKQVRLRQTRTLWGTWQGGKERHTANCKLLPLPY